MNEIPRKPKVSSREELPVGRARWHATPTRPRRRGRKRSPRTRTSHLSPRGMRPQRCVSHPTFASYRVVKAPVHRKGTHRSSSPHLARARTSVVAGESRAQAKGKRRAPRQGRAAAEGGWRQKVQDMQGGERARCVNVQPGNRRRRRRPECPSTVDSPRPHPCSVPSGHAHVEVLGGATTQTQGHVPELLRGQGPGGPPRPRPEEQVDEGATRGAQEVQGGEEEEGQGRAKDDDAREEGRG